MNRKPNRSADTKNSRRERAFTVVELAVVLVAVGLLVLVALPSLARSDNYSGRTVCHNNLRQMGMAVGMYAADNRDYLAWPNWGNDANISGWLYTPTNGAPPDPTSAMFRSNPTNAWRMGHFFPYVKAPQYYLCPVDIESVTYAGTPGVTQRAQKLSSYVMDGAAGGYDQYPRKSARITQVWNPTCYLLWEPDEHAQGRYNPGAFDYNDGANYPATTSGESIGKLHSVSGGEALSVDGGIRFVSVRTWNIQSTNSGRSLLWWSPFSSNGH
jgi:type II secretory pathway pseudopilin PulG